MVMSKKLLTLGSLATFAVALPGSQRPLGDDEDNDTPLPLIIWHGEHRPILLSIWIHIDPPYISNYFPPQVSETPTEMKASSP